MADALSWKYEEVKMVCTLEIMDKSGELSEIDKQLIWEAEKRGFEIPVEQKRVQMIKDQHALGHFGVESCCQRIQ